MVVATSSPDALIRSSRGRLISEAEPSAETWSVSRTSNLVLVGLLLPILAPKAFCFARHIVTGHGSDNATPILRGWLQMEYLSAQLCDFILQFLNALFQCLRHAPNIALCLEDFHDEFARLEKVFPIE